MTLSRPQVAHVALLARLGLGPDEEAYYADQLSGILAHIERMAEVDTDSIPPTAQVVAIEGSLREDVARASLPQAVALANAPRAEDGYFVVPAIQAEVEP